MDASDALSWLILIVLGGSVGALGQGARMVVGIKKLNDAANGQSTTGAPVSLSDLIVVSQLVISIIIGFIAGALAAVVTSTPGGKITGAQIAGLAAAGYSGADFIEGFMSRFSAAPGAPAGQPAIGTGESPQDGSADGDGALG